MSVEIIADVGDSHYGDLNEALRLIEIAKECGADSVKFQAYVAEKLYPGNETLKANEVPKDWWPQLKAKATECDIDLFASVFDLPSLVALDEAGLTTRLKIASSELTNHPLIRIVSQSCERMIISTGMAFADEVREALAQVPPDFERSHITVLHCTSLYPTEIHDLNLSVIGFLKEEYPECSVGLSDHSSGTLTPAVAVGAGARVIEKHLGMPRSSNPYHILTPEMFKLMIQNVRIAEAAMGGGSKMPVHSEMPLRNTSRYPHGQT